MKTFVIGDIHGGKKALEQVLERARPKPEDHLIFLGDYVDGWSDAVATLDFLMALRHKHRCTFLRGNHDELCADWLAGGEARQQWLIHGGQATVDAYGKTDEATRKKHLHFLTQDLENYYLDAQNRLFLHAGFTNLKGVDYEYFSKTFYWDRTLWELALSLHPDLKPGDPFYPKRLLQYPEVFIGHTPLTRIGKTEPMQAASVWNLDTGAAFTGPLTLMEIDSKIFWQSDPVYTLYPNEKGRN